MTDETNTNGHEPTSGIPGLVRIAAVAGWRTVKWSVETTVSTGREVVERTMSGEPAQLVLQDKATELRDAAVHALGLDEMAQAVGIDGDAMQQRLAQAAPMVAPMMKAAAGFMPSAVPRNGHGSSNGDSPADLLAQGQQLLRRSAQIGIAEEGHPAYAHILTELTPDEARILRFLYQHGPQPSIDIRTYRPFGIGSELVASGLNMIAEHAGCRHLDRIHPYLTNLFRLGLVEFSKEQVENPNRYQLIEAQPTMQEAMQRAGFAPKSIRRSIHLNSFGTEFCRMCLIGEASEQEMT